MTFLSFNNKLISSDLILSTTCSKTLKMKISDFVKNNISFPEKKKIAEPALRILDIKSYRLSQLLILVGQSVKFIIIIKSQLTYWDAINQKSFPSQGRTIFRRKPANIEYFHVLQGNVVLTLTCIGETQVRDHSNESY